MTVGSTSTSWFALLTLSPKRRRHTRPDARQRSNDTRITAELVCEHCAAEWHHPLTILDYTPDLWDLFNDLISHAR